MGLGAGRPWEAAVRNTGARAIAMAKGRMKVVTFEGVPVTELMDDRISKFEMRKFWRINRT